ncbi:unnamed protein product [Sphagnum tenellum]
MAGSVKTDFRDLENLSHEDMLARYEAMKAAVAAIGPDELFWFCFLWNWREWISSKSRVWLLAILKQHMVGARLQFFSTSCSSSCCPSIESAWKASSSVMA